MTFDLLWFSASGHIGLITILDLSKNTWKFSQVSDVVHLSAHHIWCRWSSDQQSQNLFIGFCQQAICQSKLATNPPNRKWGHISTKLWFMATTVRKTTKMVMLYLTTGGAAKCFCLELYNAHIGGDPKAIGQHNGSGRRAGPHLSGKRFVHSLPNLSQFPNLSIAYGMKLAESAYSVQFPWRLLCAALWNCLAPSSLLTAMLIHVSAVIKFPVRLKRMPWTR